MNDEILARLKAFTLKEAALANEVLDRKTKIERDLGITGDDAVEFVLSFSKEFNVDVSKFMLADYFSAEGVDFFGAIARLFTKKEKPKLKELTLGHLEKAIIAGRLDEDVINSY